MIRKSSLVCLAVLFAASTANAQDVTGDFKVTGIKYENDVASVSGSVNHGAIQSNKSVVVDMTYDYSFIAEKTETIPGETITTTVFVPGKCVTDPVGNAKACFDNDGNPKATNGAIWKGTYETSTVTTPPTTVTTTINPSSQGMTAITEPTVVKGRLNPKGKITGYNWEAKQSIVPSPELVDPALVPAGYTVVLVTINSISYTAYLVDANGGVIADTVISGVLYQ